MQYRSNRLLVWTLRGLSIGFTVVAFTATMVRADEPVEKPAPKLRSANPRVPAGHVVRLNGRDLGGRELWYGGPPLFVDGEYLTVVGWGPDRIYVQIPPTLTAGEHTVRILNHRIRSNALRILVVPIIDEATFSRDNGRDGVVLRGGGFGPVVETSSVSVDGKPVTPVGWSPTAVTLPASAVTGRQATFTVTVNGLTAEYTKVFDGKNDPVVNRAILSAGLKDTELTLTGNGFGDGEEGDLRIDAQPVKITQWSDHAIAAIVPGTLPTGVYQLVVSNGASNIGPIKVAVIPTVRALSFAQGKPGDELELIGAHFPQRAADVQVFIGQAQAKVTKATSQSITISIPPDAAPGQQLLRVIALTTGFESPAVPFKVVTVKRKVVKFEDFGE